MAEQTDLDKKQSESEHDVYTYQSLPQEHIRVLVLKPSLVEDAPPKFYFNVLSLQEARGGYDAVSYTWGDPAPECVLYNTESSQATRVMITTNLNLVLRRYRHRLDEVFLWADAVCIDQKNDYEKAVQIGLMDKIYQGARRVLAWTGPGGGGEEKGVKYLIRLSQVTEGEDIAYSSDQLVRSIHAFFRSPWFRRLWIVQETILNVDLQLTCGPSELSFARLTTGLRILKNKPCWPVIEQSRGVQAVTRTITLRENYQLPTNRLECFTRRNILSLVQDFAAHGCQDPRDRIFAMYSAAVNIAPKSSRSKPGRQDVGSDDLATAENPEYVAVYMGIDYDKDVRQTYLDFARACLNPHKASQVLLAAALRSSPSTPAQWPSWVPDWRLAPTQDAHISPRHELGRWQDDYQELRPIVSEGSQLQLQSSSSSLDIVTAVRAGETFETLEDLRNWVFAAMPEQMITMERAKCFERLLRSLWMFSDHRHNVTWLDWHHAASHYFPSRTDVATSWPFYIELLSTENQALPPQLMALIKGHCVFISVVDNAKGSHGPSIGIGPSYMEIADRLLPARNNKVWLRSKKEPLEVCSLILRPDSDKMEEGSSILTTRLIGAAWSYIAVIGGSLLRERRCVAPATVIIE